MAFSKFPEDYMEVITSAYYCASLLLTFTIFIVGTLYLQQRDRRDALRKEWRQFAETLGREYSKLKDNNIHQSVSEVKDSFGNVKVCEDITCIDVLRYMIDHADYKTRFRTPQLDNLREDLQKILHLLRTCASLILLGTVPNNFKKELGEEVTDLGEITLPFFKGERRKIILKCLANFGNESSKDDREEKVRDIDMKLEKVIPYVKFLSFKAPVADNTATVQEWPPESEDHQYIGTSFYASGGPSRRGTSIQSLKTSKYTYCKTFILKVHVMLSDLDFREETAETGLLAELRLLFNLNKTVEEETHLSDVDSELQRELWNQLFAGEEENSVNDVNSRGLRVLHEVRMHIHSIVNRRAINAEEEQNIAVCKQIYERQRVKRFNPMKAIVRERCQRFIQDLQFLMNSNAPYHESKIFLENLRYLYSLFDNIVKIRKNRRA